MGEKLHRVDGGFLLFHCPGCDCCHGVHVRGEQSNPLTGAAWDWNGSMDAPTFSPSILVRGVNQVAASSSVAPVPGICHSFVRDGQIEFLGDCTHDKRGSIVDLPDWD